MPVSQSNDNNDNNNSNSNNNNNRPRRGRKPGHYIRESFQRFKNGKQPQTPSNRGRSVSPNRSALPPTGRGRSASPGRGRGPPMGRGRSVSPSRNSGPPPGRSRSTSPSRISGFPPPGRGRSTSPYRGGAAPPMRGRSASPSAMRGAPRGRSFSPNARFGGRTGPPGPRPRSLSPSRQIPQSRNGMEGPRRHPMEDDDRRGDFSHGGGGGNRLTASTRRLRKSRFGKAMGRSIRHIAPKEKCNFWKVLSYLVPILLLIVALVGLIITTGHASRFTPQIIKNLIPGFNPETGTDPYAGKAKVPYWNPPNGGKGGLTMTVVNALDDKWKTYFEIAVKDWDDGNPDALTLSTEQSTPDSQCTPITGKLKVCNGNYGQTNWRGINNGVVDGNGYLVASTSRMNDYYLQSDQPDTWQYTMCHEMGHGFGCPHTDENFTNPPLGNCLDYTFDYAVSKQPSAMNWNYLLGLYGAVGGLRRGQRHLARSSKIKEIPASVLSEAKELLSKLEKSRETAHEFGWKLLDRSVFGEQHQADLQSGYKMWVHMLMANVTDTNRLTGW